MHQLDNLVLAFTIRNVPVKHVIVRIVTRTACYALEIKKGRSSAAF
jgi:hypothetical protein